jgi:drug/metabolite transporter (DMT)-like permease
MVVAALCFTPFAAGEVWQQAWAQVSWTAWVGLIYGATDGMVIAMVLWGKAMPRWGATQTMLYVYLEPVSAVVIAAMVLGEALYLIQAVGAVVHPWWRWPGLFPCVVHTTYWFRLTLSSGRRRTAPGRLSRKDTYEQL